MASRADGWPEPLIMAKIQKSGVIRLNESAINSMSEMLTELFKEDQHLKINHSKLASFILSEFHYRYFDKAKHRLILAHQDKKKFIMDKIDKLDIEKLDATIKYLEKIKKGDSFIEESQKN